MSRHNRQGTHTCELFLFCRIFAASYALPCSFWFCIQCQHAVTQERRSYGQTAYRTLLTRSSELAFAQLAAHAQLLLSCCSYQSILTGPLALPENFHQSWQTKKGGTQDSILSIFPRLRNRSNVLFPPRNRAVLLNSESLAQLSILSRPPSSSSFTVGLQSLGSLSAIVITVQQHGTVLAALCEAPDSNRCSQSEKDQLCLASNMATSTEEVLSSSSSSSPSRTSDAAMVPLTSTVRASASPTPSQTKQNATVTPSFATVICCDSDHSVPPASCAANCSGCPSSATSSPCSDIHHISGACIEPSCGAASSSTNAIICSTAVACCDDTACTDAAQSPCSPSSYSVPDDCSSMTLAVPTLSACCVDQACPSDPSSTQQKNASNVCDGMVQPSSKAHTHAQRNKPSSRNECRECCGSLTSTGTAEGGQLYSSFQELLDCCCCSMPPSVDKCCVGSTPYPCSAAPPAQADTASPALTPHQHRNHIQDSAPPPPPPLSDTPSSTNATQCTSPGGRQPLGSRASTVSTAATPQPIGASPSSTLPWQSSMLPPSPFHPKAKHAGLSAFDNHHHSPAAAVSFEDILSELQSWNDCMFEQPHLHSSQGGCLPPAMTLCNSDICHTTAPHSHWMPTDTAQHQHQHRTSGTMGHTGGHQDARPQLCQWGGCNERFWTVEELVAHINHSHLARENAANDGVQGSAADTSFLATMSHGAKSDAQTQTQSSGQSQSGTSPLECLWKRLPSGACAGQGRVWHFHAHDRGEPLEEPRIGSGSGSSNGWWSGRQIFTGHSSASLARPSRSALFCAFLPERGSTSCATDSIISVPHRPCSARFE